MFVYTIQLVDKRFDNRLYRVNGAEGLRYLQLKQLLLRASSSEEYSEEYQSVCEFFHGHIDARRLTNQLSMMQDVCNREAYWHSLPDFGKRDNVHWLAIFRRQRYHGLRGSASPVLTATGLVNGRWRFSTPYRIDTP